VKSPILPNKKLGQHFLSDPNTARRIVDELHAPQDGQVVEIGPGVGALTGLLLDRYQKFEAIEVDERAVDYLQSQYPTLSLHQMSVLDVDWKKLGDHPLYVIGNLPYNISSPILFGLLAAHNVIAEAVLMVQREVADRIVAKPSTKEYGIPSVIAQLYSNPTRQFNVSRDVFNPKPNIESSVIRLDFKGVSVPDIDLGFLHAVVRAGFSMRRKVLRNSLRKWDIDIPDQWKRCRAEELSPEDYVKLARYFLERKGSSSESMYNL